MKIRQNKSSTYSNSWCWQCRSLEWNQSWLWVSLICLRNPRDSSTVNTGKLLAKEADDDNDKNQVGVERKK